MPKQFNKLKLKKLIAVGLSTAIVTTSTPLDSINAQMNNTNKENETIKDVKEITKEDSKAIEASDITSIKSTDELPFTEVGIKDRNDIWEADDINISTKIVDNENISKIEVKYLIDNNDNTSEYIVKLDKHPYKDTFENPSIKTDTGNYKASEIIFYDNNSQIRTIERNDNNELIFSAFDYNVNEHKIEKIEISKNSGITQGDILEVRMAISGCHKIDSVGSYYNNKYSVSNIRFDEDKKMFVGNLHINNADNYKISDIRIYKPQETVYKSRYNNEELFSKGDFVANQYVYPIENIQIDNKEDLYYLDNMTIRASLFDKANPSEIDEIKINYNYGESIVLSKNSENEFVGNAYVKDIYTTIDSISVKKANGNYINYDRKQIEGHANNLNINPKLPIGSINIENKKEEYYTGENINLAVTNVRENIDSIQIRYENYVNAYLSKNNNFEYSMTLSKSGSYKIETIYFTNKEKTISIDRNKLPEDILKALEFNTTSYEMPITSIDIEKQDNLKLFDKIKINANVCDKDITEIKLLTEKKQEIILNKSLENTFSGVIKAKYENDKINKITILKNGKEFSFSNLDIDSLKDSISISNIQMPFTNLEVENKNDIYYGDIATIEAEGVSENIRNVDIYYHNGKDIYLHRGNSFKTTFNVDWNHDVYKMYIYDTDNEVVEFQRYELNDDILSKIEFQSKHEYEYEMPIISVNIENKDNLYLFDETKVTLQVKNPNDIKKIELRYYSGYNTTLSKNSDTFEGKLSATNSNNEIEQIIITRSNGKVKSFYRDEINQSILNQLDYNVNVPIKSVNIENKDSLKQGEGTNIQLGILPNKNIDKVELYYNNGKNLVLNKSNNFKMYMNLDKAGQYNLSSIRITSDGNQYNFYNGDIKQEVLDMFKFDVSPYDIGIKSIDVQYKEIANIGESKITLKIDNPETIKKLSIKYLDGWNAIPMTYNEETKLFEGYISGEVFRENITNKIDYIDVQLKNELESRIRIDRDSLENISSLDLSKSEFKVVGYRPTISNIEVTKELEYGQTGEFYIKVNNPHPTVENMKLVYNTDSNIDNPIGTDAIHINLYQVEDGSLYKGKIEYEDYYTMPGNNKYCNLTTGEYKLSHVIAGNYIGISKEELKSNGVNISDTKFNVSAFEPKIRTVKAENTEIKLGESTRVSLEIDNLEADSIKTIEPKVIYTSVGKTKTFDLKHDENGFFIDFKCNNMKDVRQWRLDSISYKTGNNNNNELVNLAIEEFESKGTIVTNNLINVEKPADLDMSAPTISSRVDIDATSIKGKTKPNGYIVIRNRDLSVVDSIIGQGYADKNGEFNIKIPNQKQGDNIEIFAFLEHDTYGMYLTQSVFEKVKRITGEIIANDKTVEVGTMFNPLNDIKAVNRDDEDITDKINIASQNVNTSKEGKYNVEYIVEDKDGKAIRKTINVIVANKNDMLPPSLDSKIEPNSKYITGNTLENANVLVTMNNKKVKNALTQEDNMVVAEGKSDNNGIFNLKISEYAPVLENGDELELIAFKSLEDGSVFTTSTKTIKVGNEIPKIIANNVEITVGDKFDPKKYVTATYDGKNIDVSKIDVIKNDVNENAVGKYTVIYSVTINNETSTKTINVVVKEKEQSKPPITGGGSSGGGSTETNPPSTGGGSIQKPSVSENKLVGDTRYQTAIKVSNKGWTSAENVVIVNSSAIVDALSATPFAKMKDAPILLTEKDKLNTETKKEITRLKAKNIYIIGGESVISDSVINELKSMNLTVERISGEDRYKTSLEVAKRLGDISEIAVVNGVTGLPDAISIAPVAASKKMPIVLASPTEGTSTFDKYIKDKDINKSYIIGKEVAISNEIAAKLPNPERLGGIDRNETNAVVVDKFYTNKELNNMYVAKDGMSKEDDLIDALAVGVLASKQNSPVVIVGKDLNSNQESLLSKKQPKEITQVGGNGNENAFNKLVNMFK